MSMCNINMQFCDRVGIFLANMMSGSVLWTCTSEVLGGKERPAVCQSRRLLPYLSIAMQGPNSLLPRSANNKQTRAFVVGTENCGCWCWRGHRNAVALIGPTHLSSTVVPSDQARAQDTPGVFFYLEPDPPSCQAPVDGFPPTKTCFAPKTTTQRAFARLASSTHTRQQAYWPSPERVRASHHPPAALPREAQREPWSVTSAPRYAQIFPDCIFTLPVLRRSSS
jgi:hypothetical protein